MNRRDAIRQLALSLGGMASAPVISGILSGCSTPAGGPDYTPSSLSPEQLKSVGLISESIIPRTDTPGALDAGVDRFIDSLLSDYLSDRNRRNFLDELDRFIGRADEATGGSLNKADAETRDRFVRQIDAETFPSPKDERALEGTDISTDAGADPDTPNSEPFFRQLKGLVVAGYYTSEVGATQELHVAPFGDYRGDIAFESVGKSWA
jgi:gluconate 2-dehydrogenase gamma chain